MRELDGHVEKGLDDRRVASFGKAYDMRACRRLRVRYLELS